MKKIISLATVFVLITAAFSGCGSKSESNNKTSSTTPTAQAAPETTIEPITEATTEQNTVPVNYDEAFNSSTSSFTSDVTENAPLATDPDGRPIVVNDLYSEDRPHSVISN